MAIEIIGLLHPHERSETHHAEGPLIDKAYVRRLARAYEDGGFDRVLVGWSSSGPDPMTLAAYAAAHTERLGFLIAHRTGFVAPTYAARAYATLDQLSEGRVAFHTISGRDDPEQRRDGDFLDKTARYRRSREFLQVLKSIWTEQKPQSFEGTYYRFENAASLIRPYQAPRIPIYFAGASDEAFAVGAAEADVYVFYAQPLAEFAQDIARLRAEAAAVGRAEPPRIGLIVRPILAETDEKAWERARHILAQTSERAAQGRPMMRGSRDMDRAAHAGVSDARILALNARQQRHDTALWTAVAGVTQRGNSTALVGSPETVAAALQAYVALGVSTILIHGFDPLDDAADYGRALVPLLRSAAQEHALA